MDRTIARILKVNHGGEHGAIRIYRAQMAVARITAPTVLPFLRETLGHEQEHEVRFKAMMPERGSRPCRMMWLWGIGGSALGAATAMFGRRGVMVCTEAVERTVHRHLDEQLHYIGTSDPELSQAIREIQLQEQAHLEHAVQQRGPTGLFARALDWSVCQVTEILIWMSTNGESARLAKAIARPCEKGGPLRTRPSRTRTTERRT